MLPGPQQRRHLFREAGTPISIFPRLRGGRGKSVSPARRRQRTLRLSGMHLFREEGTPISIFPRGAGGRGKSCSAFPRGAGGRGKSCSARRRQGTLRLSGMHLFREAGTPISIFPRGAGGNGM